MGTKRGSSGGVCYLKLKIAKFGSVELISKSSLWKVLFYKPL